MDGTSDLLEIVDSQFTAAQSLAEPPELALAVFRLVELLRKDPRLSGVLDDLQADARLTLDAFASGEQGTRTALAQLWRKYRRRLIAARDALQGEAGADDYHGRIENFGASLREQRSIEFRDDNLTRRDPSKLDEAFASLRYWITYGHDQTNRFPGIIKRGRQWDWLRTLAKNVGALEEQHSHAWETLQLQDRTHGAVAFGRLDYVARWLNPPPAVSGSREWVTAFTLRRHDTEARDDVFHDKNSEKGERQLARMSKAIKRDLRILHQDVRTRILLGRSRLSLVRRFAARCEGYDARRLYRMANMRRRGEAELTTEFARYLFDHGLTPLLDAPVAGLRPDIYDTAIPIYVEAKRYGRGDPRRMIRKAVGQVFDTWERLSKRTSIAEAFLVVFRIGGRGADLPVVVRFGTRRLYLMLVDLVPAKKAGSRQKERIVALTEEDLRPEQGDVVAKKRARGQRRQPIAGRPKLLPRRD